MLQEHLTDAYFAANLILQDWNNDQPLLWNVDLQHVALAQGQQVVVCPPDTVIVTDAYIQTQIQGLATDETGTPMTDETGALLYSGTGGVPFVNNRVIFSVGRQRVRQLSEPAPAGISNDVVVRPHDAAVYPPLSGAGRRQYLLFVLLALHTVAGCCACGRAATCDPAPLDDGLL